MGLAAVPMLRQLPCGVGVTGPQEYCRSERAQRRSGHIVPWVIIYENVPFTILNVRLSKYCFKSL